MNIREKIVSEAYSWLGTPYHHHGMVKGAGVDCAMILVAIYQAVGLLPRDYDPRPYPHDWHMHRDAERYLQGVLQFGHEVAEPEKGDVCVWKFGRTFSHGAVYVGDGLIIHSYIGRGVVLDEIGQAELAGREVKFFSLVGKNEYSVDNTWRHG